MSKSLRSRRGISLMEVLISMFVLTVGLLGVAALIPAGRHEIVEAAKLDNAAMVGRAAFRDMQVRGFLNPTGWTLYPTGTPTPAYEPAAAPATPFASVNVNTVTNSVGNEPQSARYVAYAIDPLGLTAPAGAFDTWFPATAAPSLPLEVPPLMRIMPFDTTGLSTTQQHALFDSVMRSSFDQVLEPNSTNSDFPPSPKWFSGNSRRMSEGSYSWIATVVSDQSRLATSADATVSVAVFYKRDLSSAGADEVECKVKFPVWNRPESITGWLRILDIPKEPNGKAKPIKPGQWIMLAGMRAPRVDPVGRYNYYRWFKVIAAAPPEPVAGGDFDQQINLAGADWNCTERFTRAWLFSNIVNVYEKQMPLETP